MDDMVRRLTKESGHVFVVEGIEHQTPVSPVPHELQRSQVAEMMRDSGLG
jgi:hypothetical protein